MAQAKDLYEILGVPRDADRDAIRKAYRRLARQLHPDLNPGDKEAEERFKEVSSAWAVLEDEDKRRNYDEFGDISLESGFDPDKARKAREAFGSRFGFEGQPRGEGFREEFHFGDIDDLLGRFYGRGAEGREIRLRGADVEASLELDFLEAVRGTEKRVSLTKRGVDGEPETRVVTVRIPPGVGERGRLRLAGQGSPGIGGGPPGDLYVSLSIRPHPIFRRQGARDLAFDLPITVREAILGAQVEVPTLDGVATLTIPPGTDSGARLRLRGKGVPAPEGGTAGDLLVRIEIRVPRGLDEETQALVDGLARFEDPEIRKGLFS